MRCVSLALAVLISGLASFPVVAQQITWTAGFVNAIGSSYVETIKTVPARIEAATTLTLKGAQVAIEGQAEAKLKGTAVTIAGLTSFSAG